MKQRGNSGLGERKFVSSAVGRAKHGSTHTTKSTS